MIISQNGRQMLSGQALERSWAEIADRYLPIRAAEGIWRFSQQTMLNVPRQGWKVHVSSTILNASDVLRTAAPILERNGLAFKGVSSISELSKLNCGLYYGYSQIGKFLTIYPPSSAACGAIARELAQALIGHPAPAVPFESRIIENSPVFARFGLFVVDEPSRAMLRRPDGGEDPDRRDANPEWALPPKGLFVERRLVRGPLSRSYRAYGFISQRGKGGVYLALDLVGVPPRHCVLKEGRRHGEVDFDGNDGYSRVSQEAETLSELAAQGVPTPEMYASFEDSGHRYLVLEWMPGGSLAQRLYATDAEPIELREALGLCVQTARVVAQVNGCNWVWRDLKAANLLIDGDGRLRPIDFEGAVRRGSRLTSPWGSPGHVPPEWEDAHYASTAQDEYALGVVLRQILTREPFETNRRPIRELRPEIPAGVEQVIADLMDPQPGKRPSAECAALTIERAIADQGETKGILLT